MLFQFFSYAYSVLFKFFFCSFVFSSVGINWDLLHVKWVLDQAAATSFPWLINSGVGVQCPILGQLLLNSVPFCLHILQYVLYICLVLEYIGPCSLLRQENPEGTPHISFGILKLQPTLGTHEYCIITVLSAQSLPCTISPHCTIFFLETEFH